MAIALSGAFLVMLWFTPPLLAAAVAVVAALIVGAVRTRAVPRATADCLTEHTFAPAATVRAPKVAGIAGIAGPAISSEPSSGDGATTAA